MYIKQGSMVTCGVVQSAIEKQCNTYYKYVRQNGRGGPLKHSGNCWQLVAIFYT